MSTFRETAREAVIFMLLGLLLSSIGTFVYLHRSQSQAIKAQRDALKERCDILRKLPPGFGPWEKRLSDGQVTSQAECDFVFGSGQQIDLSAGLISDDENSRIYRETMKEAHWIKDRRINDRENALVSLVVGAYGFAAALGIWLFYRLVRFAVKG